MTYQELLDYCRRAASVDPTTTESLLEVVQALNHHTPFNRQLACEKIAFLMAEFIEEPTQQAARSARH